MRGIFGRFALTLIPIIGLLGACSSGRGPRPGAPSTMTDQTLSELFSLTSVYQRLGRIAAGGQVPFVGTVATLAGRGDSTLVDIGLSFGNRSISFQRDQGSFAGRYRVDLTLTPEGGGEPISVSETKVVRVNTFAETQRSDESIFFQQGFLMRPGTYTVSVVVRDPSSNGASRAERSLVVPRFGAGSIAPPVLVYEVRTRTSVDDPIDIVLNSRGTVAHGGSDTLFIYVEGDRKSVV